MSVSTLRIEKTRPHKRHPLTSWLDWNRGGRKGSFESPHVKEFEMDTTTNCSGLRSCSAQCSYLHSRKMGHSMDLPLGDSIAKQLSELNYKRVIFSGGGEPLEPQNIASFTKILEAASSNDLEAALITNGKHMNADLIPSLLSHLMVLRFSVPPFLHGYHHLRTIQGKIREAVRYKNMQGLDAKIIASLLIRPDTPMDEVRENIFALHDIGVDSIRIKPTHIQKNKTDGKHLKAKAYAELLDFIRALNITNVVISKIDQLLVDPNYQYEYCYYNDFNPFSIGADGLVYACCEHKYKPAFLRGNLNNESAQEVLRRTNSHPFSIRKGCFVGCKGHLANVALSKLAEAYQEQEAGIFSNPEYQQIADEALVYLVRTNSKS